MLDMTKTTEAKSDQLNAVDLTGAPKTIKITGVKLPGGDQPCIVSYEDDAGKPYKPCKGMRRGMVALWGKNAEDYAGKSLVLVINPDVTWAGAAVGGIQITHASHIDGPVTFPLALSKQKRVMYTIQPMTVAPATKKLTPAALKKLTSDMAQCDTMAELQQIATKIKESKYDAAGKKKLGAEYTANVARINAPEPPEAPVEPSEAEKAPQGTPERLEWLKNAENAIPDIVASVLEAHGLLNIEQAAESEQYQSVKDSVNEMSNPE